MSNRRRPTSPDLALAAPDPPPPPPLDEVHIITELGATNLPGFFIPARLGDITPPFFFYQRRSEAYRPPDARYRWDPRR